jgi:predicted ArsR family transcriptional regulator
MSDYYATAEEVLPLFRRTDPATSRVAASRVREFKGQHHRAILAALRLGPAGQSEIADRCGLLAHQVNKRLGELRRAGLVETTGETRPSSSGRPERVYRATAASA